MSQDYKTVLLRLGLGWGMEECCLFWSLSRLMQQYIGLGGACVENS